MTESITDTKTRLETFIKELNPNVDLAPGSVLSELLVKLAATLHNPIKNDINTLNQANSIAAALESTEDGFNEIIENIALNYGVSRGSGAKVTGKIKVTVSGEDTVYLDTGFTFYQPVLKLNYKTTSGYRATLNPTLPNELKLVTISGDLRYFIVPVEAEEVGTKYRITDQASLAVAEGFSLFNFVDARAYGNFTGGADQETDKELITRFKTGLSTRTLLSRNSIFSRAKELYPNLRDISVVTANDPEMTRSKQNILGISTLGMVDVYAKTAFGLETITLTLPAKKMATGQWQLKLDHNNAAGFYRVISILPVNSGHVGSLPFTTTFDYNTLGLGQVNTINNKYEARFTKYQTAIIDISFAENEFDGRSTSVPIGTEEFFDILVTYQPNIAELQNLLLDPNERIACADYLVKAALPCYVTVTLKLTKKQYSGNFPVDKLKQDIYSHINNLPFGERLYASSIVKLCHNYDITNVQLPVKLTGEIYSNQSTLLKLSSEDYLEIPTKLDLGISNKTTIFVSNYFTSEQDPGTNITDAISIAIV